MAFFSGLFSIAGAVNQIMKLVNWARSRLELAGAYVAGWMRAQRVHEEAAEEDLQDVRDDYEDAEDETRDDLIDALADDNPDGMRDAEGVSSDPKSRDHREHKV